MTTPETPAILSYPKILSLGQRPIQNIFDGVVAVGEKLDGSQFRWCNTNAHGLTVASKGKVMILEQPESMFAEAVEYVRGIDVRADIVFFAEWLQKPKHNVLAYSRRPTNGLCLWGARHLFTGELVPPYLLSEFADQMGIDVVPTLFGGKVESIEQLHELMSRESYLGGQQMEGVVITNYDQKLYWNNQEYPMMVGKLVSEKFKEKHAAGDAAWKKANTGRGKLETLIESFGKDEARWMKAIQHLREKDELEGSPRDIGKLVKEIQEDLCSEEKEAIKDALWEIVGKDIMRKTVNGFPEFYKDYLAMLSFSAEMEESNV